MNINKLREKFSHYWWNDSIPFSKILKLKKNIEQLEMQNEINKKS